VIRVGPAGWDYPDWQGIVYPKPKPRGFDPLAYLAQYFKTIEINSSFYRPMAAKVAKGWVERVGGSRDFRFTAKLWKRFTHERATAWTAAEVTEARAGLDVLLDQGKLGAVLLQFPWSFRRLPENEAWLNGLFAAFSHLPLVLEVRHDSWSGQEVTEWLSGRGVGLVNVDQPLFGRSIRPAAQATSPIGYVRLHGRNYRDWFRKSAGRDERYDYLYTADELRPWVQRIKQLASETDEVYAVTNNHRFGKAPANAEMIESLLTGDKVEAPPGLLEKYARELAPYATAGRLSQQVGKQGSLF
jgi:uncharacterized protein YecE (DUF72 family)